MKPWATLRVGGAGATQFLQNQLSNDIEAIAEGDWQLNAYCQHQGRMIALLWVNKCFDGFYVHLSSDLQKIIFNRFKMFALNVEVEIELSDKIIDLTTIRGYPQITLSSSEKFIPQDLNLDIDEVGVNFSKGCYPGQEVVARVKYLGTPKRRLYQFEFDGEVAVLDKIYPQKGSHSVGLVVNQIPTGFLAVLKTAEEHSELKLNNQSIKSIKQVTYTE
jgi:folate-binding protein YgfZ